MYVLLCMYYLLLCMYCLVCIVMYECKNKLYIVQKGRHCTCNVTVRRVRGTIVAVEKQYELHIVSVCL
jgi:hypothetical protein